VQGVPIDGTVAENAR